MNKYDYAKQYILRTFYISYVLKAFMSSKRSLQHDQQAFDIGTQIWELHIFNYLHIILVSSLS